MTLIDSTSTHPAKGLYKSVVATAILSPKFRLIVVSLLLALTFFVFCWQTLPLLSVPYSLKYGEGVVLDQVRRVSEAPGLYPPFEQPPFLIGNYPPVYPVVVSVLPAKPGAPFFTGRLLSILSVLASALLVLLIVRQQVGDVWGLLCSALVLATPELREFGSLMRVDSLGLALGLLGFYSLLRQQHFFSEGESSPTLPTTGWMLLATICFFLSIYTRHSLIGIPIAGYLLLFWRCGRAILIWPTLLIAAGISFFLLVSWSTNGEFYTHLIYLNRLPYESTALTQKWVAGMFPWRYLLLILSILVLARPSASSKPARSTVGEICKRRLLNFGILLTVLCPLWAYFQFITLDDIGDVEQRQMQQKWVFQLLQWSHGFWAATLIFSLLSNVFSKDRDNLQCWCSVLSICGFGVAFAIGRVGSDVNYLFEYYILIIIAIGWGVAATMGWIQGIVLLFAATFCLLNVFFHSGGHQGDFLEQVKRRAPLVKKLSTISGPILSEDPGIPSMLGRALEYQPFMYRQLSDSGVWDEQILVDRIKDRQYAAVVLSMVRPYVDLDPDASGQMVPRFGPWVKDGNAMPAAARKAVIQNYSAILQVEEFQTASFQRARILLVPNRQ